jgi:hypothetical protein
MKKSESNEVIFTIVWYQGESYQDFRIPCGTRSGTWYVQWRHDAASALFISVNIVFMMLICHSKLTTNVAPCFVLRANRSLVGILHNNGWRHSALFYISLFVFSSVLNEQRIVTSLKGTPGERTWEVFCPLSYPDIQGFLLVLNLRSAITHRANYWNTNGTKGARWTCS